MRSKLIAISVCMVLLLAMIMIPLSAFAEEKQSGGLDLPSLDSQAAPSVSPMPSVSVQPSTGEQSAVTPC